jgi:hypothetical protein
MSKPWSPPDAAEVRKRWRQVSDELVDARRNYQLNRAFFTGQQWIRWNDSADTTELMMPRVKERASRMTVNYFRSRTNSLFSRLFPQDLAFEVEPSDVSTSAGRRQRLQQTILEGCRRDCGWEDTRFTNGRFMMFGATSAVALEWDPDGNNLTVTDPMTGEDRPIGGVKLSPLSIAEFGIEPGTRDIGDALWWVRCTTLTPEQAQARYNLDEPPKADANSVYLPHTQYLLGKRHQRSEARMVMVYTYYERPRPKQGIPGCIVHVAGEHYEVHDWPFPWAELNLGLSRMNELGDTWLGDTPLTDARQVQMALNDARSAMRAHVQRAANARIMYPSGAIDDEDDLTDDVGEVIEYHPDGTGGKPEWFHAPEVPRWLAMEPQNLVGELDEIFYSYDVTRGKAPGDRNSGSALAILAEKGDSPLGPTAKDQQRMWERLGRLTLQVYRAQVGQLSAKSTVMTDSGSPVTIEWTAADIDEHPKVHVPLDSVMPRSQAATRAELVQIAQSFPRVQEAMDLETTGRVLGVSDLTSAFAAMDSDGQKAERENESMLSGQVQLPDPWDAHAIHVLRHNSFRNSPDYEAMPPELQGVVDAHVAAHERLMEEEMLEQQAKAMEAAMLPVPGGPPPGGSPPAEEVGEAA